MYSEEAPNYYGRTRNQCLEVYRLEITFHIVAERDAGKFVLCETMILATCLFFQESYLMDKSIAYSQSRVHCPNTTAALYLVGIMFYNIHVNLKILSWTRLIRTKQNRPNLTKYLITLEFYSYMHMVLLKSFLPTKMCCCLHLVSCSHCS